MLGKDMGYEERSQIGRSDSIVSRDEDTLFSETIYHYQNSCEATGWGELLDEVHGDRIPWLSGDWELLECSIGLMARSFVSRTTGTGPNILIYHRPNIWPGIVSPK